MNRLCCILTGGHRYRDINLIVTDLPFFPGDFFLIENHCVKCGKKYSATISKKAVIAEAFAESDLCEKHEKRRCKE